MAKIEKFEDMVIWQEARRLCQEVYKHTSKSPFSKDYNLKRQIESSSGSVMDNIAEGFERGGNREFIQFLGISRGSCAEVRSQLYRALDRAYITETEAEGMMNTARKVAAGIVNLTSYLKESDRKGFKFEEAMVEYHRKH
jgi:four helix bundle protein